MGKAVTKYVCTKPTKHRVYVGDKTKQVQVGEIVVLTPRQAQAFAGQFEVVGREAEPPATKPNGPTLEEYTKAGYSEDNYPPPGFAAVPSPAYAVLIEKRKKQ